MRRLLAIAIALLAGTALLAACGRGEPSIASKPDTGGMPGMNAMDEPPSNDDHAKASAVASGARKVSIEATSFRFRPAEIRVRLGDDVAATLTSLDVLHDFTIDELDAHVAAGPGETATGGFTVNKPGRYGYYCSVPGHRQAGMEGVLVVE